MGFQNAFLKLHSGSFKKVGIAYGQCKNENNILGRDIRISLMKATPSLPRKLLVHVVRHRGFQAKAQELAADGEFYKLQHEVTDKVHV